MKKSILLFFACIVFTFAHAQKADTTVVFNKVVHDFGNITKNDGAQAYSFEFTNEGNTPVIIQQVMASCGCTTSGWTKEPIAPKQKGQITVTYNPTSGTTFNKSLRVRITGGSPEETVLRVRGTVAASK